MEEKSSYVGYTVFVSLNNDTEHDHHDPQGLCSCVQRGESRRGAKTVFLSEENASPCLTCLSKMHLKTRIIMARKNWTTMKATRRPPFWKWAEVSPRVQPRPKRRAMGRTT